MNYISIDFDKSIYYIPLDGCEPIEIDCSPDPQISIHVGIPRSTCVVINPKPLICLFWTENFKRIKCQFILRINNMPKIQALK